MLNTESNACWKIVYNHILNRNGGNFVFECNLNTPHVKSICKNNNLLRDILISWNKVKTCDTNDKSHYILWNNSKIKQDKKTRYRKEWPDKGINYIHHLYDFRVNKFYSFPDFKLIYDINDNDCLMYTSLMKQIPLNIVQALDASFLTATHRNTI